MLELDRYDQISSLGKPEVPAQRRPLSRTRYDHLMVAKWLDRFGCMTTEQIHRAVLPGATLRAMQDLLRRMRDAGFVERRRIQFEIDAARGRGGSTPRVYSLTTAGYRFGQRSAGFYRSVIPRTGSRRRSEVRETDAPASRPACDRLVAGVRGHPLPGSGRQGRANAPLRRRSPVAATDPRCTRSRIATGRAARLSTGR